MFGNEEVEVTVLSSEWLNINEDVAYMSIINCINVAKLSNIGAYLYKIRCKSENEISNT
jgi:hypothetical protein